MTSPLSNRPQALGAGYSVVLPAFEGPLDLLLQLIEAEELDISTVSLVTVTDQYLRTLEQLEEIEPGALADFLVVASRLLYIKSYTLLPKPRPVGEEDEEEASGEALVRQLLEYRRFKVVAAAFRQREEQGLRVYVRTAPRPSVQPKLDPAGLDLARLQQALRKVLERLPAEPILPRVKTYSITVAEQIDNVRVFLRQATRQEDGSQRVSFTALLSRSASRIEVIVTFLAILELVKQGEVEVVQDALFGEIQLQITPLW